MVEVFTVIVLLAFWTIFVVYLALFWTDRRVRNKVIPWVVKYYDKIIDGWIKKKAFVRHNNLYAVVLIQKNLPDDFDLDGFDVHSERISTEEQDIVH